MRRIRRITVITLAVVSLGLGACANQWREGDAQISAAEMLALLEEVATAQGASFGGGEINEILDMRNDPNVSIYFADGPGPMGQVHNVLSLFRFDFLGAAITLGEIAATRVFFFDLPADGGRQNGLLIGINRAGESAYTYYGYRGQGGFDDGMFQVVLSSGGQDRLVVRSFDVQDGELAAVIQLRVYDFDGAGGEQYNGKIPTLVGFGP